MSAKKQQIQLYNTLSRQKEVFTPIDADNIRMYVCGPTVYDFAHIGNARPVIVFDILYRLLCHTYGVDHVTYVRNITDVDDKINARAVRDFPQLPLNDAIKQVTEKTTAQYLNDMAELGCLEPNHQPRATDFVLPRDDGKSNMMGMIQTLLDKGHAYIASGPQGREVLFRVDSMADYGALSKRKLDEQQAGARIRVEEHKENPADFVLWKESGAKEPGWDGSFNGQVIWGRPGWHIECSAMSEAYLGKVFDIHGGGLDLIFPHHENELAQSRCCHGTSTMANVWMHNGFLQVEGQKMSKSLGNFHTVHDVLETDKVGGRAWAGEVVRLAMIKTNYCEPLDFTVSKLTEAQANLKAWRALIKDASAQDAMPDEGFIALLSDNLNTPEAFSYLNNMAKQVKESGEGLERFIASANLIGLLYPVQKEQENGLDEAYIVEQIEQRLSLIEQKNWAEADVIRDKLLQQGIQLMDGKDASTGKRTTTWELKA